MEEKEEGQEISSISRRDFIKSAGLVLAGVAAGGVAGAGITSSLAPEAVEGGTTVETIEVIKEVPVVTEGVLPSYLEPETSSVCQIQHMIQYDMKNGRIIRGRRVHYDREFPGFKPWTITARGKTFTAPLKSPPPAFYLAHRKRADSPNRVMYPMKRVDWEPGGGDNVNAQNRGVSNYERITWEEAASLIAGELKRVADTYGTYSIGPLYGGGHSEGHNVPGSHGIQDTFLNYWALSEYGTGIARHETPATSASGGQLGGRYVQGNDYESNKGVLGDVAENCDLLLMWSGDAEAKAWRYPLGLTQGMWHRWFGELGIKRVTLSPDLNLGASLYSDKWIPILPSTDSAMMCGNRLYMAAGRHLRSSLPGYAHHRL